MTAIYLQIWTCSIDVCTFNSEFFFEFLCCCLSKSFVFWICVICHPLHDISKTPNLYLSWWLPLYFKIQFARIFSTSLTWLFRLYWPCFWATEMLFTYLELADYDLKFTYLWLVSSDGSFILSKCILCEICQKITFLFGTP